MDDCANAQGEYPPITGELRGEFTASGGVMKLDGGTVEEYMTIAKSRLDELCDAIDSVHARLEAENARLKAERDSMATALDMAEGEHDYAPLSHYMLLPKDADGVPIHVGDRLRNDSGKEVTVVGVGNSAFSTFFSVGVNHAHYASDFRHIPPDSWERIVEDAMYQAVSRSDLVARCKALAGDAS